MKKTRAEINAINRDAPAVMGKRLSRMMLPPAMKTAGDNAEDQRMISEKMTAARDGFAAANTEWSRQMMTAMFGLAMGKMPDVAKAADAIASAALKPARKTVTANAKRISGKKR